MKILNYFQTYEGRDTFCKLKKYGFKHNIKITCLT